MTMPSDFKERFKKLTPEQKALFHANQEQHRDFYAAIGHAATTWADVESALSFVFRAAIIPGSSEATPIASFYAVENFRSKLQMTDATLQMRVFEASLTAEWDGSDPNWRGLHERLISASQIRNNLAHYTVMRFPELKMGNQLRLIPAHDNPRNPGLNPKRPNGGYTIKDIERFPAMFKKLSYALHNFAQKISGEQEHFSGFELREPRQTATYRKASQTRAKPKGPPRSSRA